MGTIGNLTRPSRAALSPSKEALLRKRLQGGIQTLHHGDPGAQIPARKLQGPAPLSFAQQRLWFLHELDPQSSAYNETTALRIKGPLDFNAFEEGLNRIHERHTVLSARFPATDGTPMQVAAAHVPSANSSMFSICPLPNGKLPPWNGCRRKRANRLTWRKGRSRATC